MAPGVWQCARELIAPKVKVDKLQQDSMALMSMFQTIS